MLSALLAAVLLAPAPDLQVGSVTTPDRAAAGGQLRAPTTLANAGTRRSGRFRTRYWLSGDAARGHDVRMRSVRIPSIGAGGRYELSPTLHVPSDAKPGTYHVLACADAGRVVRERREGNNCRASADAVRVVRQTEPQIPPGPG
jgi:hypothetical protein